MKIEELIFSNIIQNENYARKVLPFLKQEYFHDVIDSKIFNLINTYTNTYGSIPSKEALLLELSNTTGLSDEQYEDASKYVKEFVKNEIQEEDWILDKTEKFCQDKAIYNAIMDSIKILDSNNTRGAIPQLLSEALSVSFDSSIGHDFLDDAEKRFDYYHEEKARIPFDITLLNKITNGGLFRKTLNILLASTGVGKSAFMCHSAAAHLSMGYNVLYITLEMAEEKIAERIDSNLLDIPIKKLQELDKLSYMKYVNKFRDKFEGKLIIKEYPTAAASVANFRHLLNELKIKKSFKPDIIYIDYLNICASARVKNTNANSYTIIKSIAEEIRGLAIEFDVPIISATQTNRDGMNSSDVDLTNTSESIGLPQSVDLMFALISTEELEQLGQIMVKQLKNRYNDLNYYKKFVIGLDRSKMKFYDTENKSQDDIIDSGRKDDDKKQKFSSLR